MSRRPAAVAFDVVQTLFPLDPVAARLAGLGLPAGAADLWYARALRDGFALAAAGVFASFQYVAEGTFRGLLVAHGWPADSPHVHELVSLLGELNAAPDVRPAFERLREAGVPVVALSNGSRSSTRNLLERAGLEPLVDHVLSIDDVKAWKPRPEVYHYAAEVAGVEPGRLALVACHPWDCHGAARAGLVSGWVPRTEPLFPPVFGTPDAQGPTLSAVCDALLDL